MGTGSLDHYLPRKVYPQFSTMYVNLVPACHHCNSGVKGTTVDGGNPRRLTHPCFDTWAAKPVWFVETIPAYDGAVFAPRPMPHLAPPQDEIVGFDLKNVLGKQFQISMANIWLSLPVERKMRVEAVTPVSVAQQLGMKLRVTLRTEGTNSWQAVPPPLEM